MNKNFNSLHRDNDQSTFFSKNRLNFCYIFFCAKGNRRSQTWISLALPLEKAELETTDFTKYLKNNVEKKYLSLTKPPQKAILTTTAEDKKKQNYKKQKNQENKKKDNKKNNVTNLTTLPKKQPPNNQADANKYDFDYHFEASSSFSLCEFTLNETEYNDRFTRNGFNLNSLDEEFNHILWWPQGYVNPAKETTNYLPERKEPTIEDRLMAKTKRDIARFSNLAPDKLVFFAKTNSYLEELKQLKEQSKTNFAFPKLNITEEKAIYINKIHDTPINKDEIIDKNQTIKILIDFPINKPCEILLKADSHEGLSYGAFVREIQKKYIEIYKEEDTECSETGGHAEHLLYRATSYGKHGIWGFFIEQLILAAATYDTSLKTWILGIQIDKSIILRT